MKLIPIPDAPKREGIQFDRAVRDRLTQPYPSILPVYTVQELNALNVQSHTGTIVRCSNGDAGAECLAYCNGKAWKVISLGDAISLT